MTEVIPLGRPAVALPDGEPSPHLLQVVGGREKPAVVMAKHCNDPNYSHGFSMVFPGLSRFLFPIKMAIRPYSHWGPRFTTVATACHSHRFTGPRGRTSCLATAGLQVLVATATADQVGIQDLIYHSEFRIDWILLMIWRFLRLVYVGIFWYW